MNGPGAGQQSVAQAPATVDIREVWQPRFPSADLVAAAAALLTPAPTDTRRPIRPGRRNPIRLAEQRRTYITVAPGVLTFATHDPSRAERTHERQTQHERHYRDQLGLDIAEGRETKTGTRQVTCWSSKSRANMIKTLAELDWSPVVESGRVPGMITLTLPGDWLTVAPTAEAAEKLRRTFLKRWHRAWGEPFRGVWKREFQRRGAPHWHLFTAAPTGLAGAHRDGSQRPAVGDGMPFGQRWLCAVWADIVDHPDHEERRRHGLAGAGWDVTEGLRSNDPRRLAVYFAKHGSYRAKDYQNEPPAEWAGQSVGRYWGMLQLDRATVKVEVRASDYDLAKRITRRWSKAQRTTREVSAPRVRGGRITAADAPVIGIAGAQFITNQRVRRRKVRRRVVRLAHGRAGFVCLNDAPAFTSQLARWLEEK